MRKSSDSLYLRVLQQAVKKVSHIKDCSTKRSSSTFTTYIVAEDQQYVGVLRVVCDLHDRDKGKGLVGEALSKVIGDKDPRALTSRHLSSQDHLQARVQH